eukprot:CAMPEP_0175097618 /NCGR_PEP_ID=MMETSP0086_2-20121207/5384_1 /TAXON_ID=136419 /ORGANISM="Unknown Unknown, Strain D1" /LENGTH=38 /DNA_ID= /DNA_START= /DNA_END= /DNA_ORIENTATION=
MTIVKGAAAVLLAYNLTLPFRGPDWHKILDEHYKANPI